MTSKSIEQVVREHTSDLMSIPGVTGTAQGLCNQHPCIKVFVTKMNKQIKEQVPERIEGYTVKVEETGTFKAF